MTSPPDKAQIKAYAIAVLETFPGGGGNGTITMPDGNQRKVKDKKTWNHAESYKRNPVKYNGYKKAMRDMLKIMANSPEMQHFHTAVNSVREVVQKFGIKLGA